MKYNPIGFIIIKTALLIALTMPACVYAKTDAPPKNIAKVNGKAIPYSDFENQLEIFKQQIMRGKEGPFPAELMEKAKEQVVQQMIAEELLFQESTKQGVQLEPDYVNDELKSIKDRFPDEANYNEALKRMNMTEDQLRYQINHKGKIRKLIEKEIISKIQISKEDVKTYFETNKEKFHQPERVRAQHILIKVSAEDDDKKKAEARKKLEDLKKKILAGDDFGKLAKENSEGPSNVREGDLGYFTKGRMAKPFEDVAFKLSPNEVSDIVETQFGYHLIKVLDHQPPQDPAFEDVESRITASLRNERLQRDMQPYLEKLKKEAKIEMLLK